MSYKFESYLRARLYFIFQLINTAISPTGYPEVMPVCDPRHGQPHPVFPVCSTCLSMVQNLPILPIFSRISRNLGVWWRCGKESMTGVCTRSSSELRPHISFVILQPCIHSHNISSSKAFEMPIGRAYISKLFVHAKHLVKGHEHLNFIKKKTNRK